MTEKDRAKDREGAMSDSPAVYEDASSEVRAAAETLRAVEGLRRRSEYFAKARAFPLFVWAGAFTAVLPVALFARKAAAALDTSVFVLDGEGNQPAITFIAVAVAAIVAAAISMIDYRRQPVHLARERKQISLGEGIVLGAAALFLGPLFIGAVVSLALTSMKIAFVGASVLAVLIGNQIRNRALSVAGVAALFGMLPSQFIWSDRWPAVAVGSYILTFSIGGIALTIAQRRSR